MEVCRVPSFAEQISKSADVFDNGVTHEVIKDVVSAFQQVESFLEAEENSYILWGGAGGLLSSALTYWWATNLRRVDLACWCCNEISTVCVRDKNRWICKHCDQFNGFTPDGDVDYAAEAEARGINRFQERSSVYCQRQENSSRQTAGAPRLCQRCENNQQYKVRALKNFVPNRECDFEVELEAFERRIEQSCAPCITCQRNNDRYLAYQSAQMPMPALSQSHSRQKASILDSIISSRRSKGQSRRFSKLAISRMILVTYSILFLSAIGSLLQSDWTTAAILASIAAYTSIAFVVGGCAPSMAVISLFALLFRRQMPQVATINFDLPQFVPGIFEVFDQLEELEVHVGCFCVRLHFIILIVASVKMHRHFRSILNSQIHSKNQPISARSSTPTPPRQRSSPPKSYQPHRPPTGQSLTSLMDQFSVNNAAATPRVQNPYSRHGDQAATTVNYATPPPSFVSMRSSSANSMLRQSRLNFLKRSDSRSVASLTPEPVQDDISPYDSVSNYGEDEPMETSFGQAASPANTSFGSDVASVLEATLNTSVQVASSACKWLMVVAVFANLVFFVLLARKIYEYAPNAHRLKL